jgi:hypothetical protein
MKPQNSRRRRSQQSNTADKAPPNAGTSPAGSEEMGTSRKKPPVERPPVINVAELSATEIENAWDDNLYVPPTDPDPFVRCQKVVIAYCLFYAPTMDAAEYTAEEAYAEARRIARPIAALGAGIPLTLGQMSEYAYEIYDSLASWADANDRAAQAIRGIFEAYALPRGSYRQVKAVRPQAVCDVTAEAMHVPRW